MSAIDVEKDHLAGEGPRGKSRVVEIGLLLESGLLTALAAAAFAQGRTPAAMIRHLIRDFVSQGDTEEAEVAPSQGADCHSACHSAAE